MSTMTITLIDEGCPVRIDAAVVGEAIRVDPRALGWKLEPEGLCRDDTCVPIRNRAELVHDDGIDLAAFARLLDRPLASEPAAGVAALGASAGDRGHRLAAMDAPDFTLPDLAGRPHSLRDQRGKKTLLIAWASW